MNNLLRYQISQYFGDKAPESIKAFLEAIDQAYSQFEAEIAAIDATMQLLRRSEENFRMLVETARDIVYRLRLNPKPHMEYISPSVKTITGYSPEEIKQDLNLMWVSIYPDDQPIFRSIIREGMDTQSVFRVMRADGSIVWLEHQAARVVDHSGKVVSVQGIARDITQRKQMEDDLAFLSYYDALTSLYNRTYFEEELRRYEHERYRPIAVVMADVDGLKMVNDTQGHKAGDELIRNTAVILTSCFRKGDVVARIGGDEFAAVMPRTSEETAQGVVDRIRLAIEEHNQAYPGSPVSVSVGVAICTEGASIWDTMKEADKHMYREKTLHKQKRQGSVLETLEAAMEYRDLNTSGQTAQMERLLVQFADHVGLPPENHKGLGLLAKFYDMGKMSVSDTILFKPGPLTLAERAEVEKHAEAGYRIALSAPELAPLAEWILKHHEWWNGKGYPLGLKEGQIPVEARLLAIVDAYQAMVNERPYRPAMRPDEAVTELVRCAGEQFDPYLVTEFIKMNRDDAVDEPGISTGEPARKRGASS